MTTVTLDKNHHGLPYRTPNKTGQGAHRFFAHANVTAANGKTYRAAIYQTCRACNLQTVEVTLYGEGGRMLPESNLPHVRAAVIAAYVEAFGLLPHDAEHAAPAPIKLTAKPVQTIDATPSWAGLIPALVAMIENGTAESRALAIEELTRLARSADKQNAIAFGIVKQAVVIAAKEDGESDVYGPFPDGEAASRWGFANLSNHPTTGNGRVWHWEALTPPGIL